MIAFAGPPSSSAVLDQFPPELDDAFFDRLFNAPPDSFELSELAELAEAAFGIDLPAQLKWQPRPDKPERFDQQSGFYNCLSRGVVWMLGGNGAGCLGAEQEIFDPVANQFCKVSEIDGPFHVWARTASGESVIAKASQPRVYGKEDLYRVTLSNGRSVLVTLGHRVLSDSGDWREIGDIVQSARVSNLPPSFEVRKSQCHASEFVKQFVDHTEESKQSDSLKVLEHASEQSGERASISQRYARHVLQSSRGRALSFVRLKNSRLSFRGYGLRSLNRPSGFQDRYSLDLRLCGGRPLQASSIDRVSVLQSADADGHSLFLSPKDDLADALEYSLAYLGRFPQSMNRSGSQVLQSSEAQCVSSGVYSPSSDAVDTPIRNAESSIPATRRNSTCPQFPGVSYLTDTSQSLLQSATVFSASCSAPLVETNSVAAYVTSIEFVRHDEYWDFSVEEHENYWMEGAWHHNTTETTMAKVAKFVLNTPAPRKDTPFWVIGGSYEQSMETCWKEKLYGHGHILDDDIDWDRISWYRPKQQLPYRIPLLPTACQADRELFRSLIPEQYHYTQHGNWSLEFKSWRQGADQMMARSIGGFAFVEQFPWGVFTEVLRGCREYNLPGSKMVEYTPVDPDLSGDIEEMIQNGKKPKPETDSKGKAKPEKITLRSNLKYLPDDWEIFHANTECAMEAGHVSKEWFDEYFGMIPKESLNMRLKGLFAAFEGVIYKTFDPTVHVVGDEIFDWILSGNCSHRRAVDWGAGPQNAFVCLWGARNRLSQWFIYDELYSTDQEKTTVDHLIDITRRHPWPNQPWYGTTYADPSSPGNIRLAQQLARITKQMGEEIPNLNMSMARNAVTEGIEHVQWLLKRSIPEWNEFTESMIQRPRLFIHYSCVNTIREMKKYRWVKGSGADGRTDNPLNPRPEPLKFDDHCMDALRYLTFSDDSQLGLTIESARTNSKAAQSVAKSNGNWRDLISGNGLETSFGGRYGRGKKNGKSNQQDEY